jgi:hypothetical protein
LGEKKDSRQGVRDYRRRGAPSKENISTMTALTKAILDSENFDDFNLLLREHEKFVSNYMGVETIGKSLFADFWGQVKSLGAWGGDFVLATSYRSANETKEYFQNRLGHDVIFSYKELILERNPLMVEGQSSQDSPEERSLQ